jgi:DMSO/TMAO reductase YedYZ molybdopterin-dependent catalytic subunit
MSGPVTGAKTMRPATAELLAILCATMTMVVVMAIGRFTLSTPLIPELIAQQIFALVTPQLFTAMIRLFGFGAKWLAFGLAVAGYIAGGVGLGWLYTWWLKHHGRTPSIRSGGLFGMAVGGVIVTFGMPLLGAGVFGVGLRQGAAVGGGGLLALHLLYGSLLGGLTRLATGRVQSAVAQPDEVSSSSRRRLLRGMVALPAVGLIPLLSSLLGHLGSQLVAAMEAAFDAIKGLSPEVTPNEKFYTISINLFDPTINPKTWKLTIRGLVEKPLQLSLEELKALPSYEAYVTFASISNEIGGKLLGNARWKGVPLRTLLEMAQLKPDARRVVLRSDDGYSTGIPLERCLRPQTFLAYEMNGHALPDSHGFPLRAVVPGYYGMKQPKWLTEIELVAGGYQGYWEERGWADEAVVKTLARIDVPAHRAQIPLSGVPIGGIAFAGDRGIQKVEFSQDGGKTWQEATLKLPLSSYAWTLWKGVLALPSGGEYLLVVRATDNQGTLQDERISEPLPNGVSGYHKVRVKGQGT